MKTHFWNITLTFALLFLMQICCAQTMYVRQINNIQTTYSIDNISKMTFSSGNILIDQINGNDVQFYMDSVRYIAFQLYTVGIQENNSDNQKISVYPNPVSSILNIDLRNIAEDNGTIQIMSMNGSLLKSIPITFDANPLQIDVSGFAQGVYLCKINCTSKSETLKFIKQ